MLQLTTALLEADNEGASQKCKVRPCLVTYRLCLLNGCNWNSHYFSVTNRNIDGIQFRYTLFIYWDCRCATATRVIWISVVSHSKAISNWDHHGHVAPSYPFVSFELTKWTIVLSALVVQCKIERRRLYLI